MSALQVPMATHPELGTIAARALNDDELRSQLLSQGLRDGLRCASCGSDVSFVDADLRTRHFRHRSDAACLWGPETHWHLAIKDAFVHAFQHVRDVLGEHVEEFEVQPEVSAPGGRRWQADVACTVKLQGRGRRRLMVEVQQSPQSTSETVRRTRLRYEDGWDVLWVNYRPGEVRPPRWLAAAAPTVAVAPATGGALQIVGGWVDHRVVYEADLPDTRATPREIDEVAWESWDEDPRHLLYPLLEWVRGEGLMFEDVAGRAGLAWVELPDRADADYEFPVITDTFSVWEWNKEARQAEREAENHRKAAALTEARDELGSLRSALLRLLSAVSPRYPFRAQYPAECMTCSRSIATGDTVALGAGSEHGRQKWWLFCEACWDGFRKSP